jgi:hypothetical protein
MKTMAMAMATSLTLAPSRAATVSASISGGNENMASIARMITESTAPRKKPAISPSGAANENGDADDLEGGPHGDASAPDQPAQDVTAQVVGAQPVQRGGPGIGDVQVLQVGRVGGDERGEDGRHYDEQQEGQAAEGKRLVTEPVPEARPRPCLLPSVGAVVGGWRGVARAHEGIRGRTGEGQAHTSRIFGLR